MSGPSPVKLSLRLPPAFAAEASAYADSLGVSLNALCAVALREYLDRPKHAPAEAATAAVAPGRGASPQGMAPAGSAGGPSDPPPSLRSVVPKVAKGQPCPCGSGKPYGKCHGRQP
jgi:hypothetical protein